MHSVASARRAFAVSMGKVVRDGSRRLGKGNGSAVPGAVALAIDPGMLASLASEIPQGAMLASSGRFGHLPADDRAIGLFEVDEGSFPGIVGQIGRPRALVFTNVFRDQLDRYMEPAYMTSMLERAMQELPADTTLVLNADDPRVAYLAPDMENPRLYFGIQDTRLARDGTDPTSDFPRCPRCGSELAYRCVFYAHLGHWSCHRCGLARPEPQVRLTKIELLGSASSRVQVT